MSSEQAHQLAYAQGMGLGRFVLCQLVRCDLASSPELFHGDFDISCLATPGLRGAAARRGLIDCLFLLAQRFDLLKEDWTEDSLLRLGPVDRAGRTKVQEWSAANAERLAKESCARAYAAHSAALARSAALAVFGSLMVPLSVDAWIDGQSEADPSRPWGLIHGPARQDDIAPCLYMVPWELTCNAVDALGDRLFARPGWGVGPVEERVWADDGERLITYRGATDLALCDRRRKDPSVRFEDGAAIVNLDIAGFSVVTQAIRQYFVEETNSRLAALCQSRVLALEVAQHPLLRFDAEVDGSLFRSLIYFRGAGFSAPRRASGAAAAADGARGRPSDKVEKILGPWRAAGAPAVTPVQAETRFPPCLRRVLRHVSAGTGYIRRDLRRDVAIFFLKLHPENVGGALDALLNWHGQQVVRQYVEAGRRETEARAFAESVVDLVAKPISIRKCENIQLESKFDAAPQPGGELRRAPVCPFYANRVTKHGASAAEVLAAPGHATMLTDIEDLVTEAREAMDKSCDGGKQWWDRLKKKIIVDAEFGRKACAKTEACSLCTQVAVAGGRFVRKDERDTIFSPERFVSLAV